MGKTYKSIRKRLILKRSKKDNRDKVMVENIKNYEINLLNG